MKSEADYLSELVAFETVTSDKDALARCARYCAQFFKNRGLHTELVEFDGYPNVIATSRKTKSPKVLLQCHMDVVPAGKKLFSMKKSGSKLTGRGVFDMKFACASYMKLLDELEGKITNYDFGIMLTFDEEVGGRNGVEALLKKGYKCDICILPDSGKGWRLEATANGAWFIRLSAQGKSAHGSMPELAVNAAENLNRALGEILKLRDKYSADDLTLSLTQLDSGKAINQIPDYAEAVLDIRYKTPGLYEDLKKRLEKLCAKHNIKCQNIELFPCVTAESGAPLVDEFVNIAEGVLERKISRCHSTGATDARYFCAYGIPCVVIQPDGGGRHGNDEWVDAQGLKELTRIIFKFITEYGIMPKR